jgi:hypothetical protein
MEPDDFRKGNDPDLVYQEDLSAGYSSLVERLRGVLAKQSRLRKIMILFHLSLSIIYIAAMSRSEEKLGLSLMVAGFVSAAIYLYFRYKPFPDNFYILPVKEFFRLSYRRLKYISRADFLILIPILALLGSGGGFHLVYRLSRYTEKVWLVILIWIIFYIGLCIFGFWAGKKDWKKEYGSLMEEVERIEKSFSDEED